MAAARRGRTTAYGGPDRTSVAGSRTLVARRRAIRAPGGAAALIAVAAAAVLPSPAAAQSTGGATAGDPAAPLSPPPPGVVVRPAPVLRSWRCVRQCQDARTAGTGALLRIRGRSLRRAFEVVFLGAEGDADDVAAAPVSRRKRAVTVRVPLGAAAGPLLVADRDGLESKPSGRALALAPAPSLKVAGTAPAIEVQARARRAFFDAKRPAGVTYVVHADSPTQVQVELLRSRDGAVVRTWDAGEVSPETQQTLTWNGMAGGRLQPAGRYEFRVSAVSPSGVRAVSAGAGRPDPAEIHFLRHEFPVRGPHYFGEFAARFGGGRGHQGQDVFAACGTPLVAARGGMVKFKQYHSRAGHYLVIDGSRTGIDYAYMHLRDAALVDEGDRVRTGQPIGYVGQTGAASGCHLHFEMWTAPGWYDGGHAFDPLPSLLGWDRTS